MALTVVLVGPAAAMDEGQKRLLEGDYPAAFQRFAEIAVDSPSGHQRRFAALQVWYVREEAFRAVERDLQAGRLDDARTLLHWIRESLDHDDSPFEEARLRLLEARWLLASGEQVSGSFWQRMMDRLRRVPREREEALEKAWSVLDVPGPFFNVFARSEALYLIHEMAREAGDKKLVGEVEQALRNEREVHPFWAERILPEGWKQIGAPTREDFLRIRATAGQPFMPEQYSAQMEGPDTIRVTDFASLAGELQRLADLSAEERKGKVVYVPGDVEIEIVGRDLIVPSGVLLLSDRGLNESKGAILRRRQFDEASHVVVLHSGAELVGFRILGEMDQWSPTYDETRTSPPGCGVALASGHDHGKIINCEIANFRRDGVNNFGRYLQVAHCHLHNFGGYGILSSRIGRWTLGENNRIEWSWMGVGGARTWNTSYQMYGNYLLDARRPETALTYREGPFSYGSAMGHHGRIPQGYAISVVGNVFERTSEEVLSYRTVSPRSGVEHGVFIGHNWVRQPHFPSDGENLAFAVRDIQSDEGGNSETYVSAHFSKEGTDPRDIELRTRTWPGNLFNYGNLFGEEMEVLEGPAFSRSLVRWLEPGLMPSTDRPEVLADMVKGLQRATPGPDAKVKAAWEVKAFPGCDLKSVRVLLEGPFQSPAQGLPIGPVNPDATEVFSAELDGVTDFFHEAEFALGEANLQPGIHRLLIVVANTEGREAILPGYFSVVDKK